MVEIGQLEVIGSFNDSEINQGFDRVKGDFKDVEQQANQTNATLNSTTKIAGGLGKTLIGLGVAGIGAMVGIASKSPLLAGTFAKMEVQTLKLSNVLGRQLKPVFDEIAQNLIPSISQAFLDGEGIMGTFVDKTVLLIGAISDLISLDFEGLGINLNKIFAPKGLELPEGETQESLAKKDPFFETRETIKEMGTGVADEKLNGNFLLGLTGFAEYSRIIKLFVNGLVDTFQFLTKDSYSTDMKMANAEGTGRP